MNVPAHTRHAIKPGIELGFFHGEPVIYDGTEPVAIDAQAGKGKLTRFLGVNPKLRVRPCRAGVTTQVRVCFSTLRRH